MRRHARLTPSRWHARLAAGHLAAAALDRPGLRRDVMLLLAGRHAVESVYLRRPTRTRRMVASGVDLLHAATAVAWAVWGPRDRPLGALSATVALVATAADVAGTDRQEESGPALSGELA